MTDNNPKYAVLNTERNLLLKLGQFGQHFTNNREKAETKANDTHLKVVKVEFVNDE